MKIVDDDLKNPRAVYCYFCCDCDCDERFYLESLIEPVDVTCPKCGNDDIAISSAHLNELDLLQS
ncbi:hypothetical protein [Cytobacillus praedii]|uniref:Uncharacterized protein n=1 Tax=Cytobacillus praedii TaxID=1742358 RepID=A0A4R1AQL6_9BACI|nr:hypothetical protein [Cytobacillus praedii]TCJ00017.1 hypothetical protein E0Y62_26960 [Cytobacillus praedii]